MKKVIFVCHGSICRSPAAEAIFLQEIKKRGKEKEFACFSYALSNEEIGNDIYPPAKETLRRHGIPFDHHYARQIEREDLDRYDLIVCADRSNIRAIERMFGPSSKLSLMMHWAGEERDVSDPWYTRDFEAAYRDIYTACEALLKNIL